MGVRIKRTDVKEINHGNEAGVDHSEEKEGTPVDGTVHGRVSQFPRPFIGMQLTLA